ncbi:MAG: glycosyltransferase family 9 protein [Nitrospinota bacterium]|jgi:heptosyltransferase-2|nr:glycosyltransferase family 9 protein [Nitrospinota bacterium]
MIRKFETLHGTVTGKMDLRMKAKRWLARFQAPWVTGTSPRSRDRATDPRTLKAEKSPRILVIAYPPGLGDTVTVTPFLSALEGLYQGPSISVLAGGETSCVLGRHPAVARVIRYEDDWISKDDKRGPKKGPDERRALRDRLRRENFHAVFDLLGNYASARLAASVGSALRIGYSSGFDAFLTHPVADRRFAESAMPMADYHLDLLRRVGLEPGHPPPAIATDPEEETFAEERAKESGSSGNIVGLAPASANSEDEWPARKFAEAADAIIEAAGGRGLLLGAESDRPMLEAVAGRMRTNPLDLCGRTTVLQAASLMRRCRLLLTVDTGLMHLGGAVGVKLVALLRNDNPLWRPWGKGHRILTGLGKDPSPGALRVEDVVRAGRDLLESGTGT